MSKLFRTTLPCLLLAALFVLLPGCKKDGETPSKDTEPETEPPTTASDPYLPEQVDLEQFEFTVLCREPSSFLREVWTDSESQDPIDQALYSRNVYVETYFNCFINASTVADTGRGVSDQFRTEVLAGEPTFQLALGHMIYSSAETGYMKNWYDISNIDLTQPWWHQSIIENLTINNRMYLTASDYNITSVYYTWTMIFNTAMATSLGYNVYNMVENNEWTLENFITLVHEAYRDDGNGQVDIETDTFGFVTHYNTAITNWMFALEIPVTKIDDDDHKVEFLFNSERMLTATQKMKQLLFDGGSGSLYFDQATLAKYGIESHDQAVTTKFASNTALFTAARIIALENLRDSKLDYGIVPYPKYDSTQTGYHSHVDGAASLMFVPNNLSAANTERVGMLVEALSYLGYRDVLPEISNTVLMGRYSRDSKAWEMLQLTLNSRSYDFAYVYDFSAATSPTPYWLLSRLMEKKSTDVVSTWRGSDRTASRNLSDLLELYFKEEQ